MWNSHLEQHPYNCSSDYTVLLHYTAPDPHGQQCNVKGRQFLCQSHNFVTHARPFGLPCSEAMFTHTRARQFNLSVLSGAYIACTRMPYVNFDMSSPRSSRPTSY
jgi:hypothetical protein